MVIHYKKLDFSNTFFVVFAGVSCIVLVKKEELRVVLKEYWIYFLIIAAYYTFALFGRTIFMNGPQVEISLSSVVACTILFIVLFPTSIGVIWCLNNASLLLKRKPTEKSTVIQTGIMCFAIVFFIETIISLGYYPCTMTTDSYDHWKQATGEVPLNDYSPVIYTLLIRALVNVFNSYTPYPYTLFQIFMIALVIGEAGGYLSYKGVNKYILAVISMVFSFLPSTFMLSLYLSKNPMTAILCLWVTLSLVELIIDPQKCLYSHIWLMKSIIAIAGLYMIRENNVVIILPLGVFIVWFLYKYKKHGMRIMWIAGGVICVVVLTRYMINRNIEFSHVEKNHETIRPLLAPVASALKNGVELPDEILNKAEQVLPLNEWAERYSPFDSDPLTWGDPLPDYSKLSYKEAFDIYFRMLWLHPDIVIKDRLDGANLIWDIRAEGIYAYPVSDDIRYEAAFGNATLLLGNIGSRTISQIRALTDTILSITERNGFISLFVFKNGIYVYLLLIMIVFLRINNHVYLLWAIAPSAFILITYILVIAWQMYFYIWFFPLSVIFFMFISLVEVRGIFEP